MANFDSGVSAYIRAQATVTVSFPVDSKGNSAICCSQCQFYSRNNRICQLTKSISAYPDKYVGDDCPLKNVEEEW